MWAISAHSVIAIIINIPMKGKYPRMPTDSKTPLADVVDVPTNRPSGAAATSSAEL